MEQNMLSDLTIYFQKKERKTLSDLTTYFHEYGASRQILPQFTQTFSRFVFLFYCMGTNEQWLVCLIFPTACNTQRVIFVLLKQPRI